MAAPYRGVHGDGGSRPRPSADGRYGRDPTRPYEVRDVYMEQGYAASTGPYQTAPQRPLFDARYAPQQPNARYAQQQPTLDPRHAPQQSASYPPSSGSPSPPPAFMSSASLPASQLDDGPKATADEDDGTVSAKGQWRDKTWNTAFGPVSWRKLTQRKYMKYYIIVILISIGAALITIFHKQIVVGLQPFANDLEKMKLGWLIPVGILFVISFPPLFGHEIITVLCGLVWGLWKGFGIVALGTFLGELGNFFTFKYACTGRSDKLERTDLNYACMCLVVREGGFWIAFLARLSAIPGHLVTPVFATTGMRLWVFCAATLLSMPKQLAAVYVGTLFEADNNQEPTSSKVVEYVVLGIAVVITIVAMWYIYRRMGQKRPEVERIWAERRQQRLAEEGVTLPTLLNAPPAVVDEVGPAKARPYGSSRRPTAGEKLRDEQDGVRVGLVGHAAAPGYAGVNGSSSSTVDLPHSGQASRNPSPVPYYEDPYGQTRAHDGPSTIEFVGYAPAPKLGAAGSAAPIRPPRTTSVADRQPAQGESGREGDDPEEFYRRKSRTPHPPDVVEAARARSEADPRRRIGR